VYVSRGNRASLATRPVQLPADQLTANQLNANQ
jgi:hypothetical protein